MDAEHHFEGVKMKGKSRDTGNDIRSSVGLTAAFTASIDYSAMSKSASSGTAFVPVGDSTG